MAKILVPVDGSDQSCRAAAWAAKSAARAGDTITLLYVFEITSAEAMALAPMTREDIDTRVRADAAPGFEKAQAAMGDGVSNDTLAVIGNPADEIIGIGRAKAYDHIVMGSRGLSSLQELLLGSVSEKVLRRAHCAVTIVR